MRDDALQLISMAFGFRLQRVIPHWYHRAFCALVGVRIRQVGLRTSASPVLVLSNHVSWLDICVIGALNPVVFIAKSEVARWPVFGWLAKLQRTIFIDRQARHKTGAATQEIGDRLIGAVHHALGSSTQHSTVTVQPMSLAYVGFDGLPPGRALRERVAWYGDADLIPHFIGTLASGAIDVTVSFGEAVAYDMTADRKQIARDAELSVRRMTTAALRAGPAKVAAPPAADALPVPGAA
jgi:hypothetical protein